MRTLILGFIKKSLPAAVSSLVFLAAAGLTGCDNSTDRSANGGLPQEDRYIYRPFPDAQIEIAGKKVALSQLWQEKPLLFTMVYTRCAGVCYPFVWSLKEAIPHVGGLGKDYRIVVVSFDPEDNVETMQTMARRVGLADQVDWLFGVTSENDIQRLAESIGYWKTWDPTTRQYDHPAMLVGVTQNGHIARFLVGADVAPARLYEVVRELRGEYISAYPLPRKNVIFSCFQYDPAQGLTLDWGFLLLLLPGVVTIGGTCWVFWRAGRIRRHNFSH